MFRLCFFVCFVVLNLTYAYGRDAEACIAFHVVDDLGIPVNEAKVNVYFDMQNRADGCRVIGNTDSNGICRLQGRTSHTLEIEISKEGYYGMMENFNMFDKEKKHEIKWGKWQPWGIEKKIVLPKVRSPAAIRPKNYGYRFVGRCHQWIGFDIVAYDYVKPWGTGTHSDFEVCFEWDGEWGVKYKGMALKVRFTEPFAGAYWEDKFDKSELDGIYQANTNAVYQREFCSYTKIIRDENGKFVKKDRQNFDPGKVLVGRSRCVTDEFGNLKSATYFQISNLRMGCGSEGAGLRCTPYYNPIPNDTNIEPKK